MALSTLNFQFTTELVSLDTCPTLPLQYDTATDKTLTVRAITVLQPLLTHRSGNVACKAFRAKRLVRVLLSIPEGIAELISVTFESQPFSEFAVLIFEHRGGVFQLPHLVQYFIDLLLQITILQVFPKVVELL